MYKFVDKTYSTYPLACKPGCNLCCTTRLFVTSIEAEHLLDVLKEEDFENITKNLKKVPRPKMTHNQTILCYMQGAEPEPEIPVEELLPCPFLDDEGLCKVYERRPLMCRLMASVYPCSTRGAELPPFLFKISTIALQLVENIDKGGLYGNLFDLLVFLRDYKKGEAEEIPNYLLSNIDVDELPILPEEKDVKSWVGHLYRTPIDSEKTFRDILNELREKFEANYTSLDFLRDIF